MYFIWSVFSCCRRYRKTPALSVGVFSGGHYQCFFACPAIAARCGESVAEGSEYRGYCDGLESVGALFAGAGAGAVE